MWTCAWSGVTLTGWMSSPRSSSGLMSTSLSTLMPLGSTITDATAWVTWSTSELAPRTVTVDGLICSVPSCSPGGMMPWSTVTGTSLLMMGSRRTGTWRGRKSRIWMRGSRAVSCTGTLVGAPPAVACSPDRSMVALKSWLLSWLATSGGA